MVKRGGVTRKDSKETLVLMQDEDNATVGG
jgi:hypothetical protein